jgi:hypothetical protein
MKRDTQVTVDEGDKIEINGNVHIVEWVSNLSIKAEPAKGGMSLKDRKDFDTDEFCEKVENGEIKVLTDEAVVTDEAKEVAEKIDIEHLTDRCRGRNGGLRSSKPTAQDDSGLEQYVWRMAQFHGGYDTNMPVMARSWLQTWLDEEGIDANVGHGDCQAGGEIADVVEKAVDAVLVALNENPTRGVQRWQNTGILG